MSWMQQLAQVYDNNRSQVGNFEERNNQRLTLLPVSHVMQSAQIEILITAEGSFKSAKVIEKENARTIVPATTASANRSNASAPHFIHDKLQYVAGDYMTCGGDPKREQHYKDYYNQTQEWALSTSNAKIQAIYKYIAKGRVMADLINAKILPIDADGMVIDKWKLAERGEKPALYKVVQGGALSAFVRFDVVHESPNDPVVWEDKNLFNDFIQFLEERDNQDAGICYVTGEEAILTSRHGSRLRHAADMAKLISANDDTGYTYRGRFDKATEAVQIGYNVSQKAHHALRWLLQRQGTNIDSRYFVAFGTKATDTLDPFESTTAMFEDDDIFAQDLQTMGKNQPITEGLVAQELNKALQGIKHDMEKAFLEDVVVIALDAATTGRLAIVYYQYLKADSFYQSIFQWHMTCRWLQTYKDEDTNKRISFVGTPSTYRIAQAVYGSRADNRIKKDLYTRLLPCIIEQKPLPKDIVATIFNRVKNPFSFKNSNESWEATINIACALISKLYEQEGYTVALEEANNSRDYLFGRLLGIAEVMEKRMLKDKDENRSTNATRYFNAFSQHPARTWMVIRKQLTPYFERSAFQTGFYAMLLQKVEDRMGVENMTNDPLNSVFLLGYSSQVQDLYTKKEEKANDNVAAQN